MATVVDASERVGARAAEIAASGVKTVFRYYTKDSKPSAGKRLHPREAQQLAAAGLRIGVFYEGASGNKIDNFHAKQGLSDGIFARTYANHTIGQPAGSAIYFAIDTDDVDDEALNRRVIPYFEAVVQAMSKPNSELHYEVGVYSCGYVCQALLDRKLVSKTFLAKSPRWKGSPEFRKSGRWTVSQGRYGDIAGLQFDLDTPAHGVDIGDFVLRGPSTSLSEFLDAGVFSARDGNLDYFSDKHVINRHDAQHVPRLIELGSSAEGLSEARRVASAAISGYPHNGCAAHLCALLQLAGIDVPLTTYAGRSASHLEERGWDRVTVGNQQAGDVGVCIDTGGTPGADHVYLVIETLSDEEMLIADNQNGKKNAPHRRFATAGHGKTRTDNFIRAG